MNRMRVSLVYKIAPAGVAVLLFCAQLPLGAQEREVPAAAQASVIERLSSLWNGVTVWLAGVTVTPTPSGGGATTQGGCAADPYGCPHGG